MNVRKITLLMILATTLASALAAPAASANAGKDKTPKPIKHSQGPG